MRQKSFEENRAQVNTIENRLTNLIETHNSSPTSDAKKKKKIKNRNNMLEILYFNQQNHAGLELKILTPSQMLSRLPISLAQLKAGNNSEKLKKEIRQLLYCLYRS